MPRQPRRRQRLRGNAGHGAGVDRRRLGRVIGIAPGRLQPGDIGQIRHRRRRLEALDELGKIVAVLRKQRRPRPAAGNEAFRHAAEERFADQPHRHREALLERPRQPCHDIVAIDGEAPRVGRAARRRQPGRCGRVLQQRRREFLLRDALRHFRAQAALAGDRLRRLVLRSIMRSARTASESSVANGGTSLSHSISVATGPVRDSVWR